MSSPVETLLGYYTQMSLAHASIVVASIFGLFSILKIISNHKSHSKTILIVVYIILLIFGSYETGRYRFYSDRAKRIAISEFGAEEWWKEWEFVKPVITIIFDYSWLFYFGFGLFALAGVVYDELRNLLAKLMPKDSLKLRKLVLSSLVIFIFLIAFFGVGYILGFGNGFNDGFNNGRTAIIAKVAHHESVSLNLSSSDVILELKQMFPEKLNYTQLLAWESSRLNYIEGTIENRHTNPIEILEDGLGRCGEFSILYVSICLANDIPARLVTGLVVDHAWAEVNPSKDNKTWIHVEPTDSCVRIQKGEKSIYDNPATVNNPSLYKAKNFQMVFAFQVTVERQVIIIDRTSFYTS